MDVTLVEQARELAESRLASLPRRLGHVRAVAAQAERIAAQLPGVDSETVVAAAWLHDLGYADSLRSTGFHPVDGARFLADIGFPALVVSLVAYHTGAVIEAEERGLGAELAEFDPPPVDLLDVLTFADMTTGPDGDLVDPEGRLAEILTRYPDDDPVHRAIERSSPDLLASARRVQERLPVA